MKLDLIFLLLAVFVSAFFLSGQFIDYNASAISGAVYEIIALPMLGLFIFIPVFSLIHLWRDKFSFRSLYMYSFVITLLTFVILTLFFS